MRTMNIIVPQIYYNNTYNALSCIVYDESYSLYSKKKKSELEKNTV